LRSIISNLTLMLPTGHSRHELTSTVKSLTASVSVGSSSVRLHLFGAPKSTLMRSKFAENQELLQAVRRVFNGITHHDLKSFFQEYVVRLDACTERMESLPTTTNRLNTISLSSVFPISCCETITAHPVPGFERGCLRWGALIANDLNSLYALVENEFDDIMLLDFHRVGRCANFFLPSSPRNPFQHSFHS
jgi:hypothetical protein